MRSQPPGHGAAACLLDSAHLEKLFPASPAAQELDSGLRENSHFLSQRRVDVGISAHQKAGVGAPRLEEASGKVAGGEEGRPGQVRLIGLIACHYPVFLWGSTEPLQSYFQVGPTESKDFIK